MPVLHCYNYWRGFGEEPSAPEDVCEIYRAATKEIICNRVFSVVNTEDIISALGCSLNEATATVSYLVRKSILKVAKGGSYASGNCFVA